ncbi:hypothetical protein GCM10011613_25070 [Cellvibrio zantedeschiae]|uniref:Uncharacterized protein n=1 Tax=Cellvibrio zantedeschiae TaxID=1237077 RepID=A0ABQ3B4T0_9GAMM|nr:hypothetical protein [Cellvibrio zantedeschiae]GGY79234.1 hypothetical protein GCM10011613_25070 [Cellvibrio zantedeschiae]
MLTNENFSIRMDETHGDEVWLVYLDGELIISCSSEDEALEFIEFIEALELRKETLKKYLDKFIEEFDEKLKSQKVTKMSMS